MDKVFRYLLEVSPKKVENLKTMSSFSPLAGRPGHTGNLFNQELYV